MTVVLLLDDEQAVIAHRPRVRDRLAARLRADRIDRRLADGHAPDAEVGLALRAQVLVRPSTRALLARGLRRVIADALTARTATSLRVPTDAAAVLEAEPDLRELADRLEEPGPVDAAGVAAVRLLLTDAAGPLYGRGGLTAAVRRALGALEPRVP